MEVMAKVLFLFVLLGAQGFASCFLAFGDDCRDDHDCGQGRCDVDYRCRCFVSWKGDRCREIGDIFAGISIQQCNHFICSQHGDCHNGNVCQCQPGWTGFICDIPMDMQGHTDIVQETTTASHVSTTTASHVSRQACGRHYCYNGYCDHSHYHCVCDRGWTDYQCKTNENLCGDASCYHGDCNSANCDCHAGWTGSECETPLHVYSCDDQPCYHGNCEWAHSGRRTCECFYGWTGPDCTEKISVSRQQCGRGSCYYGDCNTYRTHSGYYGHYCDCHRGWTGASCSQQASRCGKTHCHHGICHSDLHNSETYCVCDAGWTNSDCNTREAITTTEQPTTVEITTEPPITTTPVSPTTTPPATTRQPTTATVLTASTTSTTRSTTSLPSTATTTTMAQGSTSSPLRAGVCAKFATVSDIGISHISSHPEAVSCASGNNTSPEAFVLAHCNLTTPSVWKEGINIMTNCSAIPRYTPIASFGNHQYTSAGTLCGILIGCLSDGFEIGVQYCDQPPVIEHIVTNNGPFVRDPATYYTIVQ